MHDIRNSVDEGLFMSLINQFLVELKELAPYSLELATIFTSLALVVGFVAVCLLAIRGGKQ